MFDKIKSLFIVEDETNKAKSATAKKTQANPKTESSDTSPNNPQSQSTTAAAGKVSDKFVNVLFGAMDKANLEGFDYLEFKQSLRSLDKMAMDEATKFKSAYAMAQTMGATPDNLIQTAGHYLKVLEKEEAKFEQALTNQRTKQIGGKETSIKKMQDTVAHKKQQILKLQNEIKQHEQQMKAAEKEIEGARSKVESTKRNFEVTYQAIVSQIKGDVASMKKYLKSKE